MTEKVLLVLLGLVAAVAGQTCKSPFVHVGGKCVYVDFSLDEQQLTTWQDARDFCRSFSEFNSDLASFPTCDQYTEFTRYMAMNTITAGSVWMGAHTLFSPNSWEWVTMEDLQTGVPYWYYNEDFHGVKQCAAANSNYYFRLFADDCEQKKGIACSYAPAEAAKEVFDDPPETPCPDGGLVVGDYCYVFHHQSESFSEAEKKCREDHSQLGGELYYPSSCDEFTHMAHHLEAAESHKDYWVGAIDVTGDQEWTWVNGDVVPGGPPYWASGQPKTHTLSIPNQHCTIMSKDERYYLRDELCNKRFYYICKLTMV